MTICSPEGTARHPILNEDYTELCPITKRLAMICSSETKQCEFCSQSQQAECGKAVGGALSELLQFTYRHFREEEALMRQYGVPSMERHAEDHADISAQLTSLVGQPHVGLVPIHPDALLQLIEQWIFVHVPQFDEPLDEFLKKSEAA